MNTQPTSIPLADTLALCIENLSHTYGKTRAIHNISLTIPKGITVGLIGPDGVGKSTLLSLIAGVKILQTGSINVLNLDISQSQTRQDLAHKLAFMPQGLGKNLYPTLSIYENIEFHARLYGIPKTQRQQRIERLLRATGLWAFHHRPAGKLSGGMKQKLSLCCALIHHPELLILDEPTTGVDPLSRRQFWQLLSDLRAENPSMTIIVATAYIDEAEQFEHILAMDAGHLIANQATAELIHNQQAQNLEEAYIRLLPPEKQGAVDGLNIPPFQAIPDAPLAMKAVGLSKKFGDFIAVDNVSFEIPKGEIFGFLGSNGCGKSTTMKMLTGLLDATSGTATLLGQTIDARDIETRKRVGYMSQAFSLYEELTVYQNLELHAKLYQVHPIEQSINQIMGQFDLKEYAHKKPASLPLGIRQRLQLAAACLHQPEVLILDEPTSGVDPAARDLFWEYLIHLSRQQHITIFVSTHFMNEAMRCDRISFMHAGRVLAVGTPIELQQSQQVPSLEEAFIRYLEQAEDNRLSDVEQQTALNSSSITHSVENKQTTTTHSFWGFILLIWAFAVRESKELLRDPIRLFFSVGGPLVMLLTMATSISFDLSPSKFVVLDWDNSVESRALTEQFQGSAYFIDKGHIHSIPEGQTLLQKGEVRLVIEIPLNFAQHLQQQRTPELGFYIDGAYPALAENLHHAITGVMAQYNQQLLQQFGVVLNTSLPVETRFMYNQDFRTVFAIAPGLIMLTLMLIPAMMTALGVVREKEIGSIMNLYGSPANKLQFLLGKQIPYVMVSFVSFLCLVWSIIVLFGVPLKGSFIALSLGALLIILCSTGFGLLMSSFLKSQIAAIFATAILSIIPTLNFAGLIYPTSALEGSAYYLGHAFPATWFQPITLGAFTKGSGLKDFIENYLMLILFYSIYISAATFLLKKQEK